MSNNVAKRVFLIKRRVVKGSEDLGVIGSTGTDQRFVPMNDLIAMWVSGIPLSVDVAGRDQPATLTFVSQWRNGRMSAYPRTIWDKTKKNNYKNIPKISEATARNYKRLVVRKI
jgi:hypothetical protein